MPRLRAISQSLSLAKMTYESLRNSIVNGQQQLGQIYDEMVLAKELGISRTPVREALLEFSAQGLVTFLPRKGVAIKHHTCEDTINVTRAEPLLDLAKIEKSLHNQLKSAVKNDFVAFVKGDRICQATFSETD